MRQRPRGNAPSGWSAEDLGPAEEEQEEFTGPESGADLLWLAADVAEPVEIDGAVLPYVVVGKGVHGSDRTDLWHFEPAAPPELDLTLFTPVGELMEPSLVDTATGHWQPEAAKPEPAKRPEPAKHEPAPAAGVESDPFAPRRSEVAAAGRRAAESARADVEAAAVAAARAAAEADSERPTKAVRSRHAAPAADADPVIADPVIPALPGSEPGSGLTAGSASATNQASRIDALAPSPAVVPRAVPLPPTEPEEAESDVYDLVAAAFGRPSTRSAAARSASRPTEFAGTAAAAPIERAASEATALPPEPAELKAREPKVPDLAEPEPELAPAGRRGMRAKPEPQAAEPKRVESEPPSLWRAETHPADVSNVSNVPRVMSTATSGPAASPGSGAACGSDTPKRASSSPQRTYGKRPDPGPSASLAATVGPFPASATPAPLLPLPDDRPAKSEPARSTPARSAPARPADRPESVRPESTRPDVIRLATTRSEPNLSATAWPAVQPVTPEQSIDLASEVPVVVPAFSSRPAVERPDLAWPEFSWPEASPDARGPFEPKLIRTKSPRPRFDTGPGGIEATHIHGPLVEPQQVPLPESLSDVGWLDTVHWDDASGQDQEPADADSGRRPGPFRRRKGGV